MSTLYDNYLRVLAGLCLLLVVGVATAADSRQKAVIETRFGQIIIEMLPDTAPGHVENFLKLAGSGFYDGTLFHRVIPGFMIQGGDPYTKGTDKTRYGTGGPGYTIPAEFSDQPHSRGAVSMARSVDPDSAGSQFFIVVQDSRHLDGRYTVFGRVISGMEVVDEIVARERDAMDNPIDRIEIKVSLQSVDNESVE